jgi:mRNA interferase RelE/StbE
MLQIYTVYLHKDVKKILLKIPKNMRFRIEKFIEELKFNPLIGMKMNGDLSHLRKIKISNYRVIYQIIETALVIEVIEIESRGNVFYDR